MSRPACSRKHWQDTNRQWLAGDTPIDDMPAIPKINAIPGSLIPFSDAARAKPDKQAFIHFYIDDYRQECVWNNPDRYVEMFKRFGGILSPDYSPYLDMNLYQQRFNMYRQRALGKFYAFFEIPVIPNLRIGSAETIDDALKGIAPGSTVAISTVGAADNPVCQKNYLSLLNKACGLLELKDILLYGKPLPGFEDIGVTWHEYPTFYERFRKKKGDEKNE